MSLKQNLRLFTLLCMACLLSNCSDLEKDEPIRSFCVPTIGGQEDCDDGLGVITFEAGDNSQLDCENLNRGEVYGVAEMAGDSGIIQSVIFDLDEPETFCVGIPTPAFVEPGSSVILTKQGISISGDGKVYFVNGSTLYQHISDDLETDGTFPTDILSNNTVISSSCAGYVRHSDPFSNGVVANCGTNLEILPNGIDLGLNGSLDSVIINEANDVITQSTGSLSIIDSNNITTELTFPAQSNISSPIVLASRFHDDDQIWLVIGDRSDIISSTRDFFTSTATSEPNTITIERWNLTANNALTLEGEYNETTTPGIILNSNNISRFAFSINSSGNIVIATQEGNVVSIDLGGSSEILYDVSSGPTAGSGATIIFADDTLTFNGIP